MNLQVITAINEYLKLVSELENQSPLWFRGMTRATYNLRPSLFREKRIVGLEYSGRPINGNYYKKSDAVMKSDLYAIDEFIKHYKKHYPEKCQNFNLIDYLYIMQHYDIPTRLLDFSTNPLVALYFSVSQNVKDKEKMEDSIEDFYENRGYSDKGSSIHCISPVYTNSLTYGNDKIFSIDDITKDTLNQLDLPLCIETKNSDPRISSQNGVFVLFGRDYKGYDEYGVLAEKTTKIFIPNACREDIKSELSKEHNISHTTIYPDMKGISLDIIDHIEKKYTSDCEAIFGVKTS